MRGKASPRLKIEPLRGITPACAGKSRGTPFRRTSGRDHPRVCGEKSGFCQRSILHLGSPPRMRGKEQRMREARNSAGITPAYAGKSGEYMAGEDQYGDHPRVCGEKFNCNPGSPQHWGSPPRVRGKVEVQVADKLVAGITPACAGKSGKTDWTTMCRRDHPRVCGEKLPAIFVPVRCLGSPPRVRGKGSVSTCDDDWLGITPACAGKRLKRSHSIGHFSCILCLFHSVLHRASVSGGSRAGPCAPPCLPAQNAVPV